MGSYICMYINELLIEKFKKITTFIPPNTSEMKESDSLFIKVTYFILHCIFTGKCRNYLIVEVVIQIIFLIVDLTTPSSVQ